jgi:polyisoprenoid-binding protein YceI
MKRAIVIILLVLPFVLQAQKYNTRNGYIGFFSTTPVEDIKADNNQVASILDVSNGEIVFQVLMTSFHFEKKLMQEHFNENYVESHKFPKSTFAGKIENLSEVDLSENGTYNVNVTGDLTIHGVTQKINEKGTLEVTDDSVKANSVFIVKPADYEIEIPAVVRDNIAKEIEVTVDIKYTK